MKAKYIIAFVMDGITRQFDFGKEQKDEAIRAYQNIKGISDRAKFWSIDSEDEDIWYDLSGNY